MKIYSLHFFLFSAELGIIQKQQIVHGHGVHGNKKITQPINIILRNLHLKYQYTNLEYRAGNFKTG